MPAAVITGGASGLGRALGEQCAMRGMDVALLDLDGDRAVEEAKTLASAHGVAAHGLRVDVSDPSSVDGAVAEVDARLGAADVVVSNVGVQLFGAVERFTDDEWRWVLDVNVVGSARVARSFLPLLRRSSQPRLAFTTSSSILDPGSRLGAYQASKFAVWGLAETLRLELADDGIAVTVVFPVMSRHLETSEQAQPETLRRPIASDEDFEVMVASNPGMASMLATPEASRPERRSCCCTRRRTGTRPGSPKRSTSTSGARPTSTWPSVSGPTPASGADLALADPAEPPHRPSTFVSGYQGLPVRFTPMAPSGRWAGSSTTRRAHAGAAHAGAAGERGRRRRRRPARRRRLPRPLAAQPPRAEHRRAR